MAAYASEVWRGDFSFSVIATANLNLVSNGGKSASAVVRYTRFSVRNELADPQKPAIDALGLAVDRQV
jgi:hypothetical protein